MLRVASWCGTRCASLDGVTMGISMPRARLSWGLAARVAALKPGVAMLLGLALLLVTAPAARAASVTALYLFSTFSTDPSYSGGVTTPFTLTGTGGVSLGLNAFAVATSQTGLGALESVSAFIDATVTYQSHSGRIDVGEPGVDTPDGLGARVNSEVGRLDDVGFVAEGDDAALNIDL